MFTPFPLPEPRIFGAFLVRRPPSSGPVAEAAVELPATGAVATLADGVALPVAVPKVASRGTGVGAVAMPAG